MRVLRDDLSRQLQAPDPVGVLHPFAATRALSQAGHANWLARRHNPKALLGHMYIEADQAESPSLARLKPMLAKMLAGVP